MIAPSVTAPPTMIGSRKVLGNASVAFSIVLITWRRYGSIRSDATKAAEKESGNGQNQSVHEKSFKVLETVA